MARRQIEAGEVVAGKPCGAGLEDHEEVGLEIVPVDAAQLVTCFTSRPADAESQVVAQLELQALGHFGLDRNAGNAVAGVLRHHWPAVNSLPAGRLAAQVRLKSR